MMLRALFPTTPAPPPAARSACLNCRITFVADVTDVNMSRCPSSDKNGAPIVAPPRSDGAYGLPCIDHVPLPSSSSTSTELSLPSESATTTRRFGPRVGALDIKFVVDDEDTTGPRSHGAVADARP